MEEKDLLESFVNLEKVIKKNSLKSIYTIIVLAVLLLGLYANGIRKYDQITKNKEEITKKVTINDYNKHINDINYDLMLLSGGKLIKRLDPIIINRYQSNN